jgi:hypothetical protein
MPNRTASKDQRSIIGASDRPYQDLRGDYSWVQAHYIPDKTLEAEQFRAEAELKEVIATPPDKAARYERAKAGYDAFAQRNAEALARLLKRNMNAIDPLGRIENKLRDARLDFIPWEVFERALAINENIDGISDRDRSKKVSALEKKIANIQEQRAAVMPPEAFDDNYGHYGRVNIMEVYVDFWRQIQASTCDPVAPNGKTLELSTPEEKNAWEALRLAEVMSPKAQLAAWRPE